MTSPNELPHGYEVYEDKRGEWRWRRIAQNGKTIADSGEGYASKSNAYRAVTQFVALSEQPQRFILGVDIDKPIPTESEFVHWALPQTAPYPYDNGGLPPFKTGAEDNGEGQAEQGHGQGQEAQAEQGQEEASLGPVDSLLKGVDDDVRKQYDQTGKPRLRGRRNRRA